MSRPSFITSAGFRPTLRVGRKIIVIYYIQLLDVNQPLMFDLMMCDCGDIIGCVCFLRDEKWTRVGDRNWTITQ